MTKKYAEFDMLRVVALGMILACHFIRSIGFRRLDIPLGCVGNMIFFVMSGWLLGLAWENKNYPFYGWQFLKRRLLRLAIPLWLFAIPYMIWFKVSGHALSLKDVFLNLSLLNWLARIPGMTPFWFITAISVFYIAVIALSRIKFQRNHSLATAMSLTVSVVLLQMVLSLYGIRYGYILVMMLCGALAFFNANRLLTLIRTLARRHGFTLIAGIGGGLFIVYWRLVCNDLIVVGTPLCYYLTIPIALLIAVIAFFISNAFKKRQVVTFVSSISYEVYLVHAAMLLWTKPVSGSITSYALLFLIGTFILAIPLHYTSSLLVKSVTGRNG